MPLGLRDHVELPQRPFGVSRILESHLHPQLAVWVGFFGEYGRRGAHQVVLPSHRVHPYQNGDLVAAGIWPAPA